MANLLDLAACRSAARSAGFPSTTDPLIGTSPDKAVSGIAMCEGVTDASTAATIRDRKPYSDFDAVGDQALANDYWGYSFSGLQIRSIRADKGNGRPRDELQLPKPSFAFRSAFIIWRDCRAARRYNPKVANAGFEPWSTFNSGQWKAYLQDVFAPPPGVYLVLAGDTLGRIASRVLPGSTWQQWARVNALHDPNLIFIGQRLQYPWTEHKVASGETFSGIFELFTEGITYERFRAFNPKITNPDVLAVDQVVLIPHRAL